jgi:hypothetical protein
MRSLYGTIPWFVGERCFFQCATIRSHEISFARIPYQGWKIQIVGFAPITSRVYARPIPTFEFKRKQQRRGYRPEIKEKTIRHLESKQSSEGPFSKN